MGLRFTKMQGLGNDYIYINCFETKVKNPARLAQKLSSRHFGIGSDGLILICPSQRAHARMEMYNADGSRAEMCGNGLRCVAKYLYDHGLVQDQEIRIETDKGIKHAHLHVEGKKVKTVTVDMGLPLFAPKEIPFLGEESPTCLEIEGQKWEVFCLSLGNPHCVIFVEDLETAPVDTLGPKMERHPFFPQRTNVEFVTVVSQAEIRLRVWERGSGETLACGTGACAAWVAAHKLGQVGEKGQVHLLGGTLEISWQPGESVWMTGPAVEVFFGELSDEVEL